MPKHKLKYSLSAFVLLSIGILQLFFQAHQFSTAFSNTIPAVSNTQLHKALSKTSPLLFTSSDIDYEAIAAEFDVEEEDDEDKKNTFLKHLTSVVSDFNFGFSFQRNGCSNFHLKAHFFRGSALPLFLFLGVLRI